MVENRKTLTTKSRSFVHSLVSLESTLSKRISLKMNANEFRTVLKILVAYSIISFSFLNVIKFSTYKILS